MRKMYLAGGIQSNEKIVVILHSCRTGRSYFDENGNYVPSLAENLSKSFPNLTIIAPDERVNFSTSGKDFGPIQIKYPANKRADYSHDQNGNAIDVNSNVAGNWNVFEGGKWTGQFSADYTASTAPTQNDYKSSYSPVHVNISGTVNVSNLNIRSSAGFGDNVSGTLQKGATINLTGNVNGSWSEISLAGGSKGWVATKYIQQNITVGINDTKKK
jgi:hypothetical protein